MVLILTHIPYYWYLSHDCFCFRSRILAESSPYMEAMNKKGLEVLFCYEPYDELVLMNLGQFDKKQFKSIENEIIDLDEGSSKKDEDGKAVG